MKAALCKSLDGPAGLIVEDIAEPHPGPGEVLIAVKAAALNFFDTLITRGKYQARPELPFSPAAEVAGVVAALGPDVTGVKVGDRVAAYVGWGGAREKVVAKADAVVAIPDSVSDAVAAGISVTYGTAIHGLKDRARLKAGETVAVLGAAGGAGLAAVEIAKLMGARVIAVASSADKLAVTRAHGADEAVNYASADLKDGLRALTGGRGVDVVYDCVGGDSSEAALRAMAWQGRFLVVGFASGDIPKIPLNLLLLKGCDAVGVFWDEAVKRDPGANRANMRQVLDWVAQGRLAPRIHGTYPLEKIRDALAVIDRREAVGKVVLTL
ncbi:MAG: NADPH:quinone oxidoreductase family protein [Hyphomicrobium sp.]|uniref:NADPH:quinone oxidoreductase family protein n=1 Tax=Hyphomicrobium sp. TaxID=82 RepID=UPI001320CBD7|nr:NADPH:quinone oxidoreductase family protein [Hyphomicrobium sp.]KAB2944138.1 MAG: NADPH:quinone oxidoreductase family protein [Hyphomicrobium sp.]MBZ0209438.1 NADPH:quinone oxidoreductase family protein [Hyphomicrobium sp.]